MIDILHDIRKQLKHDFLFHKSVHDIECLKKNARFEKAAFF